MAIAERDIVLGRMHQYVAESPLVGGDIVKTGDIHCEQSTVEGDCWTPAQLLTPAIMDVNYILDHYYTGDETLEGVKKVFHQFNRTLKSLYKEMYMRDLSELMPKTKMNKMGKKASEFGLSLKLKVNEDKALKDLVDLGKKMREEERDYPNSWEEVDILGNAVKYDVWFDDVLPKFLLK